MKNTYQEFHHQLIITWINECLRFQGFEQHIKDVEETLNIEPDMNQHPDFLYCRSLVTLKQAPLADENRELGQKLITQAIANYPQLVSFIPRDLFWYFGGDCMHYLGDEELTAFQNLDEDFYEANDDTNYSKLRNQHLGLH